MIYLSDGVNRGFSPVPAVGRRCIFTALSTNISLSEKSECRQLLFVEREVFAIVNILQFR